jgi:hypothetical protein
VVGEGDDKGLICTEQWSVGSPDSPKESVFGSGDSYPIGTEDGLATDPPKVGSVWHCVIAGTTGLSITGAVDKTATMSSDAGSATGFFGGNTAGKYILVGSDYKYGGIKTKWDTLGDVDPDNIVVEYLKDSSPSWIQSSFMVTDSNFKYTQHADKISTNQSEQILVGFDPDELPTVWGKVTLNINGTNYTKYWSRFRIVSDIISDPVIEQLKLHTEGSFEIEADGSTSYRGKARYEKELLVHWHLTEALEGFSPGDTNIDFADGLSIVYKDNKLVDTKTDGRGGYVIMPSGIDTSIPLQFEVLWQPLAATAGDIITEVRTAQIRVGDVLDGNIPAVVSNNTRVITAGTDNVLYKSSTQFPINKLLTGELLAFGIKRFGADVLDTFAGNVALVNVRVIGYFWR